VWSNLWLKSCVGLWSWMAQVTPAVSGAPAPPGASSPAAAASPLPPMAASPVAASPVPPAGLPFASPTGPVLNHPVASHAVVASVLHAVVLAFYFLICVALIICVMFQTTKSEGLSGVIGGSSSSSLFRGKKSAEENLARWTGILAVLFIGFSFVIWVLFGRTLG
jgi:preprotein translocase subunit SecG